MKEDSTVMTTRATPSDRPPSWEELAEEARDRVVVTSREHPYLSLAAALGLGVMIGRALPLRTLLGAVRVAREWRAFPGS